MKLTRLLLLLLPCALMAQETTEVVSKTVERKLRLPGELLPYQHVDLHARVNGFVEKVEVDRGSTVKTGQLLVQLSAPEMQAQLLEIEAKALAIEAQKAESEAKLMAAQAFFERLNEAAKTPGVIAGNEVVQAEKAVDAARAVIRANDASAKAQRAQTASILKMMEYLEIHATFSGIITQRYVHPGALAGPATGPVLRLENVTRLRLVVSVPEADVAGIVRGARVPFTIPGGQPGTGVIARISRSLDAKTRTMPVELDVENGAGLFAPGMYPETVWPVRKPRPSLMVPTTAVVTTTEKVFVIRNDGGKAQHVPVSKGAASGDLLEVFSSELKAGDRVVKRASDEIRPGSLLK